MKRIVIERKYYYIWGNYSLFNQKAYMKKLLLSALLVSGFAATAQVSFESSEGFVLGPLDDQNGWNVSTASLATGSISDAYANEGAWSLKIEGLNSTNHALVGAFSPVDVVEGDVITVSYDFFVTELSDAASDFYVGAQSPSQTLLTSRQRYAYDGKIYVVATDGTLQYVDTGATYEAMTWYNMTAVHTFSAGTIEYYLDGELIYTGDTFGATNVEQMTFLNDNYASTGYFDNLQVVSGLGFNNPAVSKLAVYPNPASNVINIENPENVNIHFVTITDLNGRMVKQVKLNAVSGATVDVSEIATGTYFVKIVTDKGATVKKIIKG
jgi:hypothetical protein